MILTTETEVLSGNPVLVHSVLHKNYMDRPGIEPGPSP